MNTTVYGISWLERIVLIGCAIMFLHSGLSSVLGEKQGVLWILMSIVSILMLLVLTAALLAPRSIIWWDENDIAVTRKAKPVLESDWRTLRVERVQGRKFQLQDASGRSARLLVDRIPEGLAALLEEKSAELSGDAESGSSVELNSQRS